MRELLDIIMVFIILSNLMLLASSRLSACIRIVAFQGIIISILPLFLTWDSLIARTIVICIGTIAVKGLFLPWFLNRALRAANVRREVEPFVSYSVSILIGILALAISLWLSSRLPIQKPTLSTLGMPVALSTALIGLFIIVSRIKALNQVLGYLVFENGIYLFGISTLLEQPLLVELGILLDVFVAVFVMGITIFHISREFEHIDTQKLDELKDYTAVESGEIQ